jgi:hypothetical protein
LLHCVPGRPVPVLIGTCCLNTGTGTVLTLILILLLDAIKFEEKEIGTSLTTENEHSHILISVAREDV